MQKMKNKWKRVTNTFLKILYFGSWQKYAKRIGVNMGEDVRFAGHADFGSEPYLITIGNHVLITDEVKFLTHEGGHWVLKGLDPKYNNTFGFGRITIKDNVYIGTRSTILRGVTIGENTIIGACSLVTKSCDPNSVYAGVPARKICTMEEWKNRFISGMPQYDEENYRKDKRREVLRIVDMFPEK